ncbi:MAG: calcium-binding protein [Paracoccaceae bacterium]
MKRKNLKITIVLGITASAMLVGAVAYAKGPGFGPMHMERPSFTELDADGDGNLSIAEMQAQATARFNGIDTNGDGVISAQESATAAEQHAGQRAEMMFARMLEWRDSDGDGSLSQAEMADTRAEMMFTRLDGDNDGVISAQEYEQAQNHAQRGGRFGHKGFGNHRNGG